MPRLSETSFAATMGIASVILLVRAFLVAGVTEVAEFTIYAAVLASGGFASIFLTLGHLETSSKSFPRLWVRGLGAEIARRADRIAVIAALLATAGYAVGVIGAAALGRAILWDVILGGAAIAASNAILGIQISGLRAQGSLADIARSTGTRAILALCLSGSGAAVAGWQGAIIGEVAATLIVAMMARSAIASRNAAAPSAFGEGPGQSPAANTGAQSWWLFGAMLCTSVAVYLDRPLAAAILPVDDAGGYGFLMLFNMGAITALGVLVQSAGPAVIRNAALGHERAMLLRYLLPRASAVVALFLVGLTMAAFALMTWPLAGLGDRYGVNVGSLVAVLVLCVLQTAVFLDWILMAADADRTVFLASLAGVAVWLVGIAAVWTLEAGMIAMVWAAVAGRLVQFILRAAGVARLRLYPHPKAAE